MTSVLLQENIPLLVSPTLTTTLVQNTMTTHDDQLFASTHGDINEPWVKIEPGDFIKFETDMYLLQKSWKAFEFPVIEV